MTRTALSRAAWMRTAVVALVGPLLVSLVAGAILLTWLPDLPDPVAAHWAGDGRPDGFASPALVIGLFGVLGVLVPVLLGGIVLSTLRSAGPSATQKLLAVVSVWVAIVLAGAALGSLGLQRGAADAAAAGSPLPALAATAALATAVAAGCWFILPPTAPQSDRSLELPEQPSLTPTERAAWRAVATLGRGMLATLVAVVVGLAAVAVIVVVIAPAEGWPVTIVPLALLLLLLSTAVWRVRVDARGLSVRSALGWPAYRIALDDIVEVRAVTVQPLVDFGGWGLRHAPGRRFGVVLAEGSAIEVERRNGRRFLVTVTDAETGAALLRALHDRSSTTSLRHD